MVDLLASKKILAARGVDSPLPCNDVRRWWNSDVGNREMPSGFRGTLLEANLYRPYKMRSNASTSEIFVFVDTLHASLS